MQFGVALFCFRSLWMVLFFSLLEFPLYVSKPYEQRFALFVLILSLFPPPPSLLMSPLFSLPHRRHTRWLSCLFLFPLVCWSSSLGLPMSSHFLPPPFCLPLSHSRWLVFQTTSAVGCIGWLNIRSSCHFVGAPFGSHG